MASSCGAKLLTYARRLLARVGSAPDTVLLPVMPAVPVEKHDGGIVPELRAFWCRPDAVLTKVTASCRSLRLCVWLAWHNSASLVRCSGAEVYEHPVGLLDGGR